MDPSALLQATGVTPPNPLALAEQGQTLAGLYQKAQMGGLDIQERQAMLAAMQNPSVLASIFGQGGGAPSGGAGGAPSGVGSLSPDQLQQYGPAIPKLLQMGLGFQKTQAEIAKDAADATKNTQSTLESRLGVVGQKFGEFLTTGNMQSYQQGAMNVQGWGLNQKFGDAPDPAQDMQGAQRYAMSMQGMNDQKTRADTAKAIADTAVQTQALGLNPRNTAVKEQEAATGAGKLGLDLTKFKVGESFQVPGTNEWAQKQPGVDDNGNLIWKLSPATVGQSGAAPPPGAGPTPTDLAARSMLAGSPSAIVDAGPGGALSLRAPGAGPPPATNALGANQGAQKLQEHDAATAADLSSKIPMAYLALQNIDHMQSLAASKEGVFAGPVMGSDFLKTVTGLISQLPGASADLQKKFSNTQAWQEQGGAFLLDTMAENKGSIPRSGAAMNAIRAIKADTVMTPDTQRMVFDFLRQAINDQISFAKNANSQVLAGRPISEMKMPGPSQGAGGLKAHADGTWELSQ